MKIKTDSPSIFTCYRGSSFDGNSDWNLPRIYKKVDEYYNLLPRERYHRYYNCHDVCVFGGGESIWRLLPNDFDVL